MIGDIGNIEIQSTSHASIHDSTSCTRYTHEAQSTNIFPHQSVLTTSSACSSPSARPAVSVKIPKNDNSLALCLSSLFVSRISLTSAFL